jgi:serine/threonine-protein kinase
MNDPRDARLGALFEQALELQRERRSAFITEACGTDASLREELISLVAAHDAAGTYFDDLSERVVAPVLAALGGPSAGGVGSDLAAGLQEALAGAYRLERELPGGGMARIFVAEDLRLKRHVVLKVLPSLMVPTASAERFQREIEVAARLQHPHIVPLLSADAVAGVSYYTMPFVTGESLRDRLAREGALEVENALRIGRDILDALAHAHANGVIHRDIKPGNILLSGRNALVTDFGIARAIETAAGDARTTTAELAIGTPAYMAPEQAAGEADVDQRVDIYQTGLVLYEMLTAKLPFSADTAGELLHARVTREAAPLTRPDLPDALRSLVMRCLAREPASRPQSAEAVLGELERVGTGSAPRPEWRDASRQRRARKVAFYAFPAVALVALTLAVFVATRGPQASSEVGPVATGATLPSIAVLPLTNLTTDPADAQLADGMTQELTAALGRTANLRVIGSTSVTALQGQRMSVRQIADSLHVSHVLEGSLQRDGPRLRMQVRLVDARDGSTRWSETYDREVRAVFDVQAEIASAVARELAARLTAESGIAQGARRYTPDIAAYEWYLRGMDLALLRGSDGRREGVEHFQRAIAIDPTYAAAYGGLAAKYIQTWNAAPPSERGEWFARAEEAALKAVALDDSAPEALAALGLVHRVGRRYNEAEAAYTRALALDTNVPRGHEGLARVYMMLGRAAEQLAEARLGIESDPLSHSAIRELALALATNGRCEESLEQLRPLQALSPPAGVAGIVAGQCYASRHMWPEAIAEFQWAADNSGASFAHPFLAYALARAGRQDEAAGILSDLLEGREVGHGSFGIATVYAGMRDYDQAFVWLDRAIDDDSMNPYIMHPVFADLHRDPRFDRFKERMGVPRP